jgi:hypothetical protein
MQITKLAICIGHSIDASYQVSGHLAKRFQRRRLLEIDLSETRIVCGGHVCYRIAMRNFVLYKDCSFHPDPLTNMATTGNSFSDWLISKKASLKPLHQMIGMSNPYGGPP